MTIEAEAIQREITDLHAFLADWFTGRAPKQRSLFERRFAARFPPDFLLVQPGGEVRTIRDLTGSVLAGYASNPFFKIAIRNVRLRRNLGDHVLATYEEWQRGAKQSTPADNGRLSTVLFHAGVGGTLEWLHLHETWMPPARMQAGPYDF